MFHGMRNSAIYGTGDLIDRLLAALERIAPRGDGSIAVQAGGRDDSVDARVEWSIFGQRLVLDIEVKVAPQRTRDMVRRIIDRGTPQNGTRPLLAAPYLSPVAREELTEAGWSYWDATGNLLVQSRRPAVWVRESGAQREPGAGPAIDREKLRSLKGPAASELIVYLLTQGETASVRELSRAAEVSVATASRVVELLRDENLLAKTAGDKIKLADRMAVAERWAKDYSFVRTFGARRYFSIAGEELALERIRASGLDYVLTGARAGARYMEERNQVAPLPSTETWLYVKDLAAIERAADLVPDSKSGNLLIAEAELISVKREGFSAGPVRTARPWRIVGDLLSAEGRLAALGQKLGELLVREAAY